MTKRICTVDACERPVIAQDRCTMHYQRARYRGELEDRRARTTEDRFWVKVQKTETCWVWTGARSGGYGSFWIGGDKRTQAHRFAYTLLVGQIPEATELDHLCRNRGCVNPSHLEPVTRLENVRRGLWGPQLRTHCKSGHEYTPENTLIYRGARRCRECNRRMCRERTARKRVGDVPCEADIG